jgi:hypothetical protein
MDKKQPIWPILPRRRRKRLPGCIHRLRTMDAADDQPAFDPTEGPSGHSQKGNGRAGLEDFKTLQRGQFSKKLRIQ